MRHFKIVFLIKNKKLLLIRSRWVVSLLPTPCLGAINVSNSSPGRSVSTAPRGGLLIVATEG